MFPYEKTSRRYNNSYPNNIWYISLRGRVLDKNNTLMTIAQAKEKAIKYNDSGDWINLLKLFFYIWNGTHKIHKGIPKG